MDLYRFIQRNYKIVCEKTRNLCNRWVFNDVKKLLLIFRCLNGIIGFFKLLSFKDT